MSLIRQDVYVLLDTLENNELNLIMQEILIAYESVGESSMNSERIIQKL